VTQEELQSIVKEFYEIMKKGVENDVFKDWSYEIIALV